MSSNSSSPRGRKRSQKPTSANPPSEHHPLRRGRYRISIFELLEMREMLSGNTYTVTDVTDKASSSGL